MQESSQPRLQFAVAESRWAPSRWPAPIVDTRPATSFRASGAREHDLFGGERAVLRRPAAGT